MQAERSARRVKLIRLILSTRRQNGDIVLVRILLFLILGKGSVATRCRCGWKYDTSLVANLLPSLTMKEF